VATPAVAPLVRYERHGPVAVLTLDHPPVNVLSAAVLDALVAALGTARDDPGARAGVISSAAAKAFAAGANIREMAPMGPAEARVHGSRGQATTVAIERLPLPVIAAVHGSCLGGGCELILACDFVVASEDATFGQPEVNLGVMPGWGGTQRLPRRIGAAAARRWILTGASVTASEAHRLGLVDQVVARADLLPTAIRLGGELAQKSATALAAAKFALNRAIDRAEQDGLAYELDLWADLFGTPDQKEGMAAFVGKRTWTPADKPPGHELIARFPPDPRPSPIKDRR
jgi:enoyl-CoA hydratase